MRSLKKFAIVSSLALLTSGCARSMPTVTDAASLCKDWRVVKYRPADKAMDARTAAEILANNEARQVWGCAKLKNEKAA